MTIKTVASSRSKWLLKTTTMMVATTLGLYASAAKADTCTGNCGTAAPNGVVTAPPAYGPNYGYVSTVGGATGAGQIDGVGGTIGSELLTDAFTAAAGDSLSFYFNYVTSDGSSFADYSFAELLNGGTHAAWLFTARTTITGSTSPGFGLPANDSVLTPGSTPIIAGAPVWAQLGTSSGTCFNNGCGYTGWIGSTYSIAATGTYQLRFGVTNFSDSLYQSGLAFAGVTLNDTPIGGAVPEPATWAMMLAGFGFAGYGMRRRVAKTKTKLSFA